MLRGGDALARRAVALAQDGEAAAILLLVIVLVLGVELEKAVEANDLTGGAQVDGAASRLRQDVDRGALQLGALHLARHRALPDELVEAELVGREEPAHLVGRAPDVGRADRLVGRGLPGR